MRDLSAPTVDEALQPEVVRTKEFVREAADFIVQRAHAALGARDEFRIALSGGNTPRPVYRELARMGHDLPWERIFVTFGDERCVPPSDERSNFRMAQESLFLPAAVPEQSVARLRGEIEPQLAAQEYQDALDTIAAQNGEGIFAHDLILLGLGEDGHTASLFPGTRALEETSRRVMANFVPRLDEWRLTVTVPLLAAAREICFLVDGNKHAELVNEVLSGDLKYPAARVASAARKVRWIIGQS